MRKTHLSIPRFAGEMLQGITILHIIRIRSESTISPKDFHQRFSILIFAFILLEHQHVHLWILYFQLVSISHSQVDQRSTITKRRNT